MHDRDVQRLAEGVWDFMRVSVGQRVLADGREAILTHVVGAEQVIVRDLATGAVQQVPTRNLQPPSVTGAEPRRRPDLSLISNEDWAVAQMRYEAVKPLLDAPRIESQLLKEIAASAGRHQATIYRWLKRYRQEGQQTALIPARRGVEPGHSRLKPEDRPSTSVRLDFMPLEQRAVTVNGIVVDNICYFHDVLRPWINTKENNGRRRRFVVRRDPRDISGVHFFDPELNQYFAIPYRDTSHPPISVWELREVRRRLQQQGRDSTNEYVIFRAYEQMRSIEETAVNKTKEMRRNIERRNSRQAHAAGGGASAVSGDTAWWEEDIQPFSEVVIPE